MRAYSLSHAAKPPFYARGEEAAANPHPPAPHREKEGPRCGARRLERAASDPTLMDTAGAGGTAGDAAYLRLLHLAASTQDRHWSSVRPTVGSM